MTFRAAAEFAIHSGIASQLNKALKGALIPDEHFYSTLATIKADRNGVMNEPYKLMPQQEVLSDLLFLRTFTKTSVTGLGYPATDIRSG